MGGCVAIALHHVMMPRSVHMRQVECMKMCVEI